MYFVFERRGGRSIVELSKYKELKERNKNSWTLYLVNLRDWSAWFIGSGKNGWNKIDKVEVDWKEKPQEVNHKGKKRVKRTITSGNENVQIMWKTDMNKALRGCHWGFGYAECGTNIVSGPLAKENKPKITMSAL